VSGLLPIIIDTSAREKGWGPPSQAPTRLPRYTFAGWSIVMLV
jgi:hypothetical protein